ncbi:type II toxin-antitoxin system RelE family toxin [Tychonema bourrellyi]|nr:hypothetical protein [Tychonema bourrellyi]
MNYQVDFKPKAIEDLASLPAEVQSRVLFEIEEDVLVIYRVISFPIAWE